MNVWMMEKESDGWSEPTPLPEPINAVQEEGEQWPSSNNNFFFTNDNRTFNFTTMISGSENIKLYTTQFDGTTFTEPEEVTGFLRMKSSGCIPLSFLPMETTWYSIAMVFQIVEVARIYLLAKNRNRME